MFVARWSKLYSVTSSLLSTIFNKINTANYGYWKLDDTTGFAKSANASGIDMAIIKFPHFEAVPVSKYSIPESLDVECGYLIVPESRSAPSGNFPSNRTLRIYFTIVKSQNENPSLDPIVFLYGGPGGYARLS